MELQDEVENVDGSSSLSELVDFQSNILEEDGLILNIDEYLKEESEACRRTGDIDSVRILGAPDSMAIINHQARGKKNLQY